MKIRVTVKPSAHKTEVIFVRDGQYRVTVTEPATQNKANQAVIRALSKYFKVAKSLINIFRGQTSRSKTIEIENNQKII